MKIPAHEAVIPADKLVDYLLVHRPEDDKSQFLARGGFTRDNPDDLEAAIRHLLETAEAVFDRSNIYGDYFRVEGDLLGVNGRTLSAITVWIIKAAAADGSYRFVTLKPGRRQPE
jgi:hypothetical protein